MVFVTTQAHRPLKWILFAPLLASMGLVGCVSSPEPQDMTRNTMQTAPADLQLACASASATEFGNDSASVLPVSSSAVAGGNFQVVLDAKGQRSSCIIDPAGTVLSVEKA